MYQLYSVSKKQDESTARFDGSNRFQNCKNIVNNLIEEGLPEEITISFISEVAREYSITNDEAQTCIDLAQNKAESCKEQNYDTQETHSAQCGYFYPSASTKKLPEKDEMDNLNNFGQYQRLMFGF